MVKDLLKKQQELDLLVRETVRPINDASEVILDGIIDPEKYFNAETKVMWVLKEAYCEGDGTGGGWDLRELIRNKSILEGGGKKMYNRMTLVTWSILNGLTCWNGMSDVDKDPSMLEALKSIAYINISKLPGTTISNPSYISSAYESYKSLLHKQIEYYNPDVLIFGGTFHNFKADLITNGASLNRAPDSTPWVKLENKIYVDAYHPGYFSINDAEYCDGIINAVKDAFKV